MNESLHETHLSTQVQINNLNKVNDEWRKCGTRKFDIRRSILDSHIKFKKRLVNVGKKKNITIMSEGNPEGPKLPECPEDPSFLNKSLDQAYTNTFNPDTNDLLETVRNEYFQSNLLWIEQKNIIWKK